jgi:hypothetical protein
MSIGFDINTANVKIAIQQPFPHITVRYILVWVSNPVYKKFFLNLCFFIKIASRDAIFHQYKFRPASSCLGKALDFHLKIHLSIWNWFPNGYTFVANWRIKVVNSYQLQPTVASVGAVLFNNSINICRLNWLMIVYNALPSNNILSS